MELEIDYVQYLDQLVKTNNQVENEPRRSNVELSVAGSPHYYSNRVHNHGPRLEVAKFLRLFQ